MALRDNTTERLFGQGVAEIEGERKKRRAKKTEPVVKAEATPEGQGYDSDLGKLFDAGVKEIEAGEKKASASGPSNYSGMTGISGAGAKLADALFAPKEKVKSPSWGETIKGSLEAIPATVAGFFTGGAERIAEQAETKRQEIRDSLGIVLREGAPAPIPEKQPVESKSFEERVAGKGALGILGASAEERIGETVKGIGSGIKYIRGTAPVKAYYEHEAKGRLAEAAGGTLEVSREVADLIKKGDKESLTTVSKMLQGDTNFTEKSFLEENIAAPVAAGAKKASAFFRKQAEAAMPETEEDSLKWYVSQAIGGVGPTLGIAVLASLVTKKSSIGLAMMWPSVYGSSYSENRSKGRTTTQSADIAAFDATTEVLSEGIPLGIITRAGGKIVTRIFKSATAEGLQEAVNGAMQIARDEGVLGEDTPAGEVGHRLSQAFTIGAVAGGGLGGFSGAVQAEKEADDKKGVKWERGAILDSIVDTLNSGEQTFEEATLSLKKGFDDGLFNEKDLYKAAGKSPSLKPWADNVIQQSRLEAAGAELMDKIETGLLSGSLNGEDFTPEHAIQLTREGVKAGAITSGDVDRLKAKHPKLARGFNEIIGDLVESDVLKHIEEQQLALPPGQGFGLVEPKPETRLRPGPDKIEGPTYPGGAEYVAGKPAPEELKVGYATIYGTSGKPWKDRTGAEKAIASDKFKDKEITKATHKIVKEKGGYGIVRIASEKQVAIDERKEKKKGNTLLSWVRSMGGIRDASLSGEVRALYKKETGVIGLTTGEGSQGLGFDELADAAVAEGWIAENEENKVDALNSLIKRDIFAQKDGLDRVSRLEDVAEKTERDLRWQELEGAEQGEREYYAAHPEEEALADLDEWEREAIEEIRRLNDEKSAREIEESIRNEVELENTEMEGLKADEGFEEYIENWQESSLLDEEGQEDLKKWREEQGLGYAPEVAGAKVEKPTKAVKPTDEEQKAAWEGLTEEQFDMIELDERKGHTEKWGLPDAVKEKRDGWKTSIHKKGDTRSVMGVDSTVKETETIDGVSYELWAPNDKSVKSGLVRVYDAESGNMVDVTKFPDFEKAKAKYDEAVKVVSKVSEPGVKPEVKKPERIIKPKDVYEATIAEEDADVTQELIETTRDERRFAKEKEFRDKFYNKAAKTGNAAQASDIIGGGNDRLIDDIKRGRIGKDTAVAMYEDAVRKGIAIPEKLDEFKRKLGLKPKIKPKESIQKVTAEGKPGNFDEYVSDLLGSKKRAKVKYEMEVAIEGTGETVTVSKDAAVALRETKKDLDRFKNLLECIT